MTLGTGLLIVCVALLGAAAQRMAGLGFALLVSPLMTLLLGGHAGVLLVNILGVVSSLLILPRVWRAIEWSMFRWLGAFASVGAIIGAWLSQRFSADVMAVAVGAIVLLALGGSLAFSGSRFTTASKTPRAVAGLASGLMNALAGVGGPAVSAYAVLTQWPQAAFAATLQPYFVLVGIVSAGAKLWGDPVGLPATAWWFWLCMLGAIVGGIAAGEQLLKRVTAAQVRTGVVVLACAGATASLARGLIGLLS